MKNHAVVTKSAANPEQGAATVHAALAVLLLTRKQVAERWGVCVHTIARHDQLKPVRFNRRLLRYRLADIEAIEAEGREPAK